MSRRDSARIRKLPLLKTVAWGYVCVNAAIGKTEWSTTLFPAKGGIYMIAVKAVVRKKEKIEPGDVVRIKVTPESLPPRAVANSKFKFLEIRNPFVDGPNWSAYGRPHHSPSGL